MLPNSTDALISDEPESTDVPLQCKQNPARL
jgi:hypothetical protein